MKRWSLMSAAFLLALGGFAFAQDEEKKGPDQEGEDEDQLTPEQAMEMLKDVHSMMRKAEELLNDSSRGKALETEKELLEKLAKEDPSSAEKQILEKIQKLAQRSEKKQKDAIDKLGELIKKAKT